MEVTTTRHALLAAAQAGLAAVAASARAAPPDFTVLALTCEMTEVGPHVAGELRSNAQRPLDYVRLYYTFREAKDGFVSGSDGNTAFNPLLPQQVSTFEQFGGRNPATASVTIARVASSVSVTPHSAAGQMTAPSTSALADGKKWKLCDPTRP